MGIKYFIMKAKLLMGISNFSKNFASALADFGKGASYALRS